MMVSNRPSVLGLLAWQWRASLLFAGVGALAPLIHRHGPSWAQCVLPTAPLAVVGGAIGIFVSFRTNSCYARWWEGRQLWGRLVNNSRDLGSTALSTLPEASARSVIRRQMAYAHLLRCALRDQDPLVDADVIAHTTEAERASLVGQRNMAFCLLHAHRVEMTRVADEGQLSEQRLQSLDRILANLHDVQGGCERLKRTPFPRGYAFIADWLILAFGCLLPFAVVRELGWFTIPINLLVCLSFSLIGEAGRVLEDPFSLFWNGLPLSALSKTIEINLRQAQGEKDVPGLPQPDAKGILM